MACCLKNKLELRRSYSVKFPLRVSLHEFAVFVVAPHPSLAGVRSSLDGSVGLGIKSVFLLVSQDEAVTIGSHPQQELRRLGTLFNPILHSEICVKKREVGDTL